MANFASEAIETRRQCLQNRKKSTISENSTGSKNIFQKLEMQ